MKSANLRIFQRSCVILFSLLCVNKETPLRTLLWPAARTGRLSSVFFHSFASWPDLHLKHTDVQSLLVWLQVSDYKRKLDTAWGIILFRYITLKAFFAYSAFFLFLPRHIPSQLKQIYILENLTSLYSSPFIHATVRSLLWMEKKKKGIWWRLRIWGGIVYVAYLFKNSYIWGGEGGWPFCSQWLFCLSELRSESGGESKSLLPYFPACHALWR